MVNNPLPMQESKIQVRSLSQKDPLEKGTATHFSILAWRIHGQKNLVGFSPRCHKESDTAECLHNNNTTMAT